MKHSASTYLIVAAALFAALFCARVNAEDLKKQISHATEIANSFETLDKAKAEEIAESLGEAFGEEEDMDALVARVEKLSQATPNLADAIAAASTAFIPTDKPGADRYAARLAAAAARAVPSMAADIARAVARQFPGAANAIANAVKGAAPGENPGQIDSAAQQGASEGSSGSGAPGYSGGGAGGGGVILPGGGGGGSGGGGSGGGGGIY